MTELHTLLAGKASLTKVVERYRAKLEAALKELNDINTALSILQKYGMLLPDEIPSIPKTVGDMAVEVLKEHKEGLTANQILDIIRERWIPDLMRSSMSPPLSRLKHMGVVELNGSTWSLARDPSVAMDDLYERIQANHARCKEISDSITRDLMSEEPEIKAQSAYSDYRRKRA